MKVHEYMIPVYATLVQRGGWSLDKVPEHYQIPVAEYLAKLEEDKLNGK